MKRPAHLPLLSRTLHVLWGNNATAVKKSRSLFPSPGRLIDWREEEEFLSRTDYPGVPTSSPLCLPLLRTAILPRGQSSHLST
ncbi:hypothetical protein F5X68DRAFT_206666 [Plectosphaerella plurivora]|uniref:Uncharacterized protein n=1 Tax=Plectosphaerella plurivora TaxID=936078 RepID=A0A9P9ABJ1_9PEZI|nr:hypothetical protein F5X68DRAFT_206666 [Plectosphaerella plurivora]